MLSWKRRLLPSLRRASVPSTTKMKDSCVRETVDGAAGSDAQRTGSDAHTRTGSDAPRVPDVTRTAAHAMCSSTNLLPITFRFRSVIARSASAREPNVTNASPFGRPSGPRWICTSGAIWRPNGQLQCRDNVRRHLAIKRATRALMQPRTRTSLRGERIPVALPTQ